MFKRLYNIWRLHKKEFFLCSRCSIPLTEEEFKNWEEGTYIANGVYKVKTAYCVECNEIRAIEREKEREKNKTILNGNIVQGGWQELYLRMDLLSGLQNSAQGVNPYAQQNMAMDQALRIQTETRNNKIS